MTTKSEAQANFQRFMDEIPNCIAVAKKLLHKEMLTYSVEEIKAFELIYLQYYKNPEQIELSVGYFQQVFESYIGTAFIWHFGGKWVVDLSKGYDSFGRIYIDDHLGKDKKGRLYDAVSISIEDWRTSLEEEGFEGSFEGGIHGIIERKIRYFSLSPDYILEPVRNIF